MQLQIDCKYKKGDNVYLYALNNIHLATIKDIICIQNTDDKIGGYIIKYQCSYYDDKIIEHFSENQLFETEEECLQYKQDIFLSKFYSICKRYNTLQSVLQLNFDKNNLPPELHNIYDKIFDMQNSLYTLFDSEENINDEYKFPCSFFANNEEN